jgi:uncharacterized membrane protein
MDTKTKDLALQGVLASLYIAITFILQGVSYGPIQFRVSEFLIILVLVNKKNRVGITVGTLIANFFSSNGMIDVMVGTLASILAMELMIRVGNKGLKYLMPALVNGVLIGLMLYYVLDLPFWIMAVEVFVSEVVVTFIPWLLIGDKVLGNQRLQEIFA